ncbi:helix-turn-helix transcriptional regulator [Streptomyces cynarae]|uniref:helix-turn-helix transcriptional regulator n=1 Tax=Streptomyces cynarae TaxID=2981134 RepID=UPI00406CF40E
MQARRLHGSAGNTGLTPTQVGREAELELIDRLPTDLAAGTGGRTVEIHISRIYRRTGVTSRAALTALVAGRTPSYGAGLVRRAPGEMTITSRKERHHTCAAAPKADGPTPPPSCCCI